MVFSEFDWRSEFHKIMDVTLISLVPKVEGAMELAKFRPISLVGSLYKIMLPTG